MKFFYNSMLMLASCITLDVAHGQALDVKPTYESKYSIGDGSVYFIKPGYLYNGKTYQFRLDSFRPRDFCRIVSQGKAPIADWPEYWYATPVGQDHGLTGLRIIDYDMASNSVLQVAEEELGGSPVEAVLCHTFEAPTSNKAYEIQTTDLGNGQTAISSKTSIIRLPFSLTTETYFGAPQLSTFSGPVVYGILKPKTVCSMLGQKLVSTQTFEESDNFEGYAKFELKSDDTETVAPKSDRYVLTTLYPGALEGNKWEAVCKK